MYGEIMHDNVSYLIPVLLAFSVSYHAWGDGDVAALAQP